MMDDRNKKKVVVITGVTRGLGRAMAEKFISLGHTVLGCGRNRQIIEEMRQKWPKRHDWDVVDVTREDQVMAWMERLHQKCGAPELLLNNAGVINRNAPLWKVPPHEFAQVMNVNVRGSYNVIRAFLPNMIKKHRGVVVNFSSGWGRAAEKEVGPYVASKWAIEGMTQALAMEMPEGLAVVSFDPGVINTDMLHSCFGMAAASHYPTPTRWAEKAVPFLLKLDATDNGHALNAPE